MCHKWGCQGGIGSISNQNYFFRLQKHKNHRTPGKKKHQIRLFLYDLICHILNNYIFSVCEGNRSLRFNFSSIAQSKNNILLGSVSNVYNNNFYLSAYISLRHGGGGRIQNDYKHFSIYVCNHTHANARGLLLISQCSHTMRKFVCEIALLESVLKNSTLSIDNTLVILLWKYSKPNLPARYTESNFFWTDPYL